MKRVHLCVLVRNADGSVDCIWILVHCLKRNVYNVMYVPFHTWYASVIIPRSIKTPAMPWTIPLMYSNDEWVKVERLGAWKCGRSILPTVDKSSANICSSSVGVRMVISRAVA